MTVGLDRAHAEARELASARLLRTVVILYCAGQMLLAWALPLTYGTSSNALARIGFATGTGGLAIWTAALAAGHLLSLFVRRLQQPTGFLHATTCLYIGLRLLMLGFVWQAGVYAVVYTLPGVAILVTAQRRREPK